MKIFQIGFNRCATTSLYKFFRGAGYKTLHWDNGNLALSIRSNVVLGKDPLNDYQAYQAFTDMEYVGQEEFVYAFSDYYKELYEWYLDSLFILNTRNKSDWIRSRLNHGNYLNRFRQITGLDKDGVILLWESMWDKHHQGKRMKNRATTGFVALYQ